MIEETFQRHKQVNPIPSKLMSLMIEDKEFSSNRLQVGALDDSGNLACAIIVLHDSKRAYYSLASTRSDMVGSGIQSWLIWELFKILNSEGILEFDFLGANIPSIARFKEKFNTEPVVYYSALYRRSPALKILKSIRSRFRS
jgi:hypothetical protein